MNILQEKGIVQNYSSAAMVILMSPSAGIQRTSSDSCSAPVANTLHLHFIHQFEVKSALANRAVV
jgi:hypothetical protein